MQIDDFLPVSKLETSRRNKSGIWNWMHFILSDLIELDQIAEAEILVESGVQVEINELPTEDFGYGLTLVDYSDRSGGRQVLIDKEDDRILTLLSCNTHERVPFPGCKMFFQAGEIPVKASFRRTELPTWMLIRNKISQFVACAREGGRE